MRQFGRALSRRGSHRSERARLGVRRCIGCLLAVLFLGAASLPGADRCTDARDDIHQAERLVEAGRKAEARPLLESAFMACPMSPQNLDLLAEAYDSLQDFTRAGLFRGQALRLRGISEKPTAEFNSSRSSVERGQTATLTWSTKYATEVEIVPEPGRVAAHGSKVVGPLSNTTYQLRATGPGGTATFTVAVTVTKARLTEGDVQELLKNDVLPERVAHLAAERGVSFDMTPQIERELRNAGADDELIEALRKDHR
jgi:hypothetical protein